MCLYYYDTCCYVSAVCQGVLCYIHILHMIVISTHRQGSQVCNIPPVEARAGKSRGKAVPARASTGGITF